MTVSSVSAAPRPPRFLPAGRGIVAACLPLAFGVLACAPDPPTGRARSSGFTDITVASGAVFVHEPAVEGAHWLPESIGSGVAIFDADGDDRLDILFLNGMWRDSIQYPQPTSRLFRQRPDGTFDDATAASGLAVTPMYGQAAGVGDYDNDGDEDVYVAAVGRDRLFRNDGDGTFTDVTDAAGIRTDAWSVAATFVDIDGDGWLDIYVVRYLTVDPTIRCADAAGREFYCPQYRYPGVPDVLLRNNGNGTFSDVSAAAGIAASAARGLGVVAMDFTDDGRPDVFVSNDGEPNDFWVAVGDGTFHNEAAPRGVAVNATGRAEASMGIAVGDVDGDADVDLFITHLRRESNTLYERDGSVFRDVSLQSGVGAPSLPYTGFGTGFADLDHDGDLDIVVANGRVFPGEVSEHASPAGYWAPFGESNLVLDNDGTGNFGDVSERFWAFTRPAATSRGLAMGDLDGDGDIDLVTTSIGDTARVVRNDAAVGNWLLIEPYDPVLRRDHPGTRIYVEAEGRTMMRLAQRAYSFMASSAPAAHFGLGSTPSAEQARVRWPDGLEEVFPIDGVNRRIRLERGRGSTTPPTPVDGAP